MSSDWKDATTVQVKAERRAQLNTLCLRLSNESGQMVNLREATDIALATGLTALLTPQEDQAAA